MAEIKIDRPLDQVWAAFTDISTWKAWWGGDVKSVTPTWQVGAQVMWATGGGTTVFDFVEKGRVGLKGSYGEKVSWSFAATSSRATTVWMGEDNSSSALVSDAPARQAEFSRKLQKLRNVVESRYPESVLYAADGKAIISSSPPVQPSSHSVQDAPGSTSADPLRMSILKDATRRYEGLIKAQMKPWWKFW